MRRARRRSAWPWARPAAWALLLASCGPAEVERPGSPETPAADPVPTTVPATAPAPGPAPPPGAATTPASGDGSTHELITEARSLADEQYWVEERISNYLSSTPLLDLRVLLLGPWSRASKPPELGDVFTDDARIAPPAPARTEEEPLTLGVVKRHWQEPEDATPLLAPEAWRAALGELHEGTARVRWALVKPAEIERTDFGARVRLKWYLNRELADGALQHDKGKWTSEWVATGEDEWRCRRLAPEPGCASLVARAPHFVDATAEAFAGTPLDPRLPTRRYGAKHRGLALADLDDDGDLDLVVTITNRVLYNRGDGTFEDKSAEVLLGGHGPTDGRGLGGVLVADFDRDGAQDIVMAGRGRRATLYLQRDGKFHPREIESAFLGNLPGSLAAHDVDGDGWLDLFVSGYGPFFDPGPNDFTNAVNGRANQMLRGLPGGRFEDVTAAWGLDAEGERWTFVGAFGDPDGDGDVDLYAANDFGPNVLYRQVGRGQVGRGQVGRGQVGGGQVGEAGAVRFAAEIESPEHIDSGFSMSATWADLDGDLDLDMYVSNMSSTAANRVRRLPGNPNEKSLGVDLDDVRRRMSKGNTLVWNEGDRFVEAGADRGAKNASWAWGTALFDYDCDGDLDIHCLNGFWTQGADDGRDL